MENTRKPVVEKILKDFALEVARQYDKELVSVNPGNALVSRYAELVKESVKHEDEHRA